MRSEIERMPLRSMEGPGLALSGNVVGYVKQVPHPVGADGTFLEVLRFSGSPTPPDGWGLMSISGASTFTLFFGPGFLGFVRVPSSCPVPHSVELWLNASKARCW